MDGIGENGDTHGVEDGDGEMEERRGGGNGKLPEVSYEGLRDLVWSTVVAGEECEAPGGERPGGGGVKRHVEMARTMAQTTMLLIGEEAYRTQSNEHLADHESSTGQ